MRKCGNCNKKKKSNQNQTNNPPSPSPLTPDFNSETLNIKQGLRNTPVCHFQIQGDLVFFSSGISWDMKTVATLKALEYAFLPADRVKID